MPIDERSRLPKAAAQKLESHDVDLGGSKTIFRRTKNGHRRIARLPSRVVVWLSGLSHSTERVCRSSSGEPYSDTGREFGGQIKTAWRGALRRAALDPELTPHDLDDGDDPIGFVRSKKGIAGIRPSRNWRSA
jgi:hypothetical protein